jgi:hypothetical protein
MIGRYLLLAGTALTLMLPAWAWAQERPPVLPTRDVAVQYRLEGGHGPAGQQASGEIVTVHYAVRGGKIRVDLPAAQGYLVVDRGDRHVFMVMDGMHSYMELPFGDDIERSFAMQSSLNFTRRGAASVAGLPCTIWDVSTGKSTGTACMTADGVMLRGRGADPHYGEGAAQAVAVSYAPQPPSLFEVPSDYLFMDLSRLSGLRPRG